jgi:serine/threonine protein kinase
LNIKGAMNKKYTWLVNSEQIELDGNYIFNHMLGKGAYGYVFKCSDKNSKEQYAIKKCRNIFKTKMTVKRTIREIKIVRLLDHVNIIKIKSILRPYDNHDFNDIYIVFELMTADLSSLIKSEQTINQAVIKHLSRQLFRGLDYLYNQKIVHRDLKSKNILINLDCSLKVSSSPLLSSPFNKHLLDC